ncbi:DUF1800 family protein [Sphingomonas sp. JC676]|uniref:DUF1800 domain-containing protein n=1 Tax=Sphingomonas sp. JC676 TaxID=2768065 RepID=UPI00165860E7|nr:DUF1800 family protein [Sphingomonas sp. JC676]MBC9032716.1 DUF1800 family protein [Sphingomonas sp. JC676]
MSAYAMVGSGQTYQGVVKIVAPGTASATSPTPPGGPQVASDAVRLAKQASFGPTPALVTRIQSLGVNGWLNEQFATTGSTYADMAASDVRMDFCVPTDLTCYRQHFSRLPVAMRFYADAISAPDQLRQRVAFALGQMIVASEQEVTSTAGIATFNQIFLTNAFGNYRNILKAVSLSGYMGDYLDMADSDKVAPNENYAREFLQLFSMGPDQLTIDGRARLDASGTRIPNYTSDDIRGVARALTGWTHPRLAGSPANDGKARDYSKPMIPVPSRYDSTAKTFLGVTVPAGAAQQASVDAVVDAAFNNASTGPFVARHLIVHLVTANPTSAYVGRVAAVFNNNGSGVRGDLKAVVRAILTDTEARTAPGANSGKVKEPVLVMTSLARAIGIATDGYVFATRDSALGQPVMRAPSVFNFYPDDFPLAGSATLKSPASKLMTAAGVLRLHNFVYDWTIQGDASRAEYAILSGMPRSSGTQPLWSGWEAFGTNIDGMVDRVNTLLFANTLTSTHKAALKAAAMAVTNPDPRTQARKRAQMILYVAATSPLFLVDR